MTSPLPTPPSFRLEGKTALVAGASSGIGLAGAVALAEAGARVTLAARNAQRLEALARDLAERGIAAEVLAVDIADIEATGEAVAARGPFDILLNSAGAARHAPAIEVTPADFDAVAGLNLRGAYFLTQAVARGLVAAGRPGSLINVSSQMGQVGGPNRSVYCATKFAVEGFTKAMAIEFGPHGIRVNTVAPTFIATPLAAVTLDNPQTSRWVLDNIKLGRVGKVEDVMGAVVYLASDASALVTGTALLVDGGWTAA